MSILIKGMEMPKSCDVCCFDLFVESCPLYNATPEELVGITWIKKARHRYCPLVEIPPHGRLIDADALQKDIQKHADLFVNCGNLDLAAMAQRDGLSCALSDVVNAPTIIESTIGQLNSDSAVNEAEEGE